MNFTPHFLSQVAASKFAAQLDTDTITIDNSEYSTWDSCFVAGCYSGGLRRMNVRSRSPLAFGGAVHAGLDAFFKVFHAKEDLNWRATALADADKTQLDALGDSRRNKARLLDILESYTLEYSRKKSMQFDILSLNGKLCVEQSFVIPLGTITIRTQKWGIKTINILWAGKIDLLTRYEGALTFVDHKTTTVMGERFVDDKVRSSQMLGYTYAARYLSRSLFNDMPVYGGRINALAMRSAGYEFKTFDIPYPDWKVAEWQKETLLSITYLVEQLDHFLITGIASPTREHCVTKYGQCSYFDVCDTPPAMRDRMLFNEDYFYVSDWSPLSE